MSPLEIHCLMEYYAMPNGSPDIHYRHAMAIEALLLYKMISGLNADTEKPLHKITAKGKAFVHHIIDLPLPVCEWRVPSE